MGLDTTCQYTIESNVAPLKRSSYDLWDLGEFDQKGARRTKWGTKEDLLRAIKVAADNGIITYIDAVLNHNFVDHYILDIRFAEVLSS